MKIVTTVARVLLGALFLWGGIAFFFHLGPKEMPKMSADQTTFMSGLNVSYLFKFVKVTELLAGLLLLINRTAALGAIVALPITLNIFLYNAILAPEQMVMGIVILLFNLYLLYAYREKYLPMVSK
ncbi:DoxX family protein [Pedobacter frigidisoli]|uniref:DoxX family protein n=1 Tax=Pedobacter frigidisoli TaxID=2530455 RepID=UPI00292F6EF5|nr:DoxX family protein [Pedobacter frigidisoli]